MKIRQLEWTTHTNGTYARYLPCGKEYSIYREKEDGKTVYFCAWDCSIPLQKSLKEAKALAQKSFEDFVKTFLIED